MNTKTVIILCLLISSQELHAEETTETVRETNSITNNQNQTSKLEKKIDLSPSSPTSEDPGFLSKLNNLIFGGNDAEAEETHQVPSIQYGSPPHPPQGHSGRNGQQRDCNPCNKEPWIPIMRSYGFPQSHDVHLNSGGNGGLYNKHTSVVDSYGTPIGSSGLEPPSSHVLESFKPPSVDYGTPNGISAPQDLFVGGGGDVKPNYGPPSKVPQGSYGSPPEPQGNYGPPQLNYGSPPAPQGNYGAPPAPSGSYGAPPSSTGSYGPPTSPQESYGPPPVPPSTYGPPKPPAANYGPPSSSPDNFVPPPSSNYGPPPSTNYGSPPSINYGPPPQPSLDYGAPVTAPAYSAPSGYSESSSVSATIAAPAPSASNFGVHYGPPKPIYKIPSTNYGPPVNQHNFGLPKPGYFSGKAPRQIRPNFQPRPYPFGPPPPPQPSYKYIPLNKGKISTLPVNFKPPPPPPNYNSGGPPFSTFGSFANQGAPNFDYKPIQVTNPEYLPPKDQLPIAPNHKAEPIAFPNLSSRPVAPLHNAQNFLDNFPQPDSHVQVPYDSNVQIQQSIPIADFVASIEHPINVIRSPILDVTVANSSSQSDSYYTTVPPIQDYGASSNNQPISAADNYDDYRLSDNPIVVEDTHVAAATNENRTVSNFNNLQSLQSGEEIKVGEELIQDILYNVNEVKIKEMPTPAISMQPPPISGESFWVIPKAPTNVYPHLPSSNIFEVIPPQNLPLNVHLPTNIPQNPPFNVPLNFGTNIPQNLPTNVPQNTPVNVPLNFPNIPQNFPSSNPQNLPPNFIDIPSSGRNVDNSSTKKPKQIQIIIPYTTNNEYDKFLKTPNVPDPLEFPHSPQSSELKQVSLSKEPNVVNIQDLFRNNGKNKNLKDLPFDIIHLQKNIDDWTEQEYSKNILDHSKTLTTLTTSTTKFIPSKRIPDDYLTTLPYNPPKSSTTARSIPKYLDHEPAGSNSKEYLESNLIATTEQPITPKYVDKHTKYPNWDKIHIAVSPLTKEKIYVVTPQPKTATPNWRQSRDNDNSTFSISILPMRNKTTESNDVRVVLSEWPHLINNLATVTKSTSTSTTTSRPTSRHPLFGLMDLSSYTPPANATIETYSGHSKVINVATASLKKRSTAEELTTTMKSPTLN